MKTMKVQKKRAIPVVTDRLAEIYEVAAQIICEKGYDATSMNDIADAIGITKAGIYHYIHGKQDLLYGIMSYGMDKLDRRVIVPALAVADAEQRLRLIIKNHSLLISEGSNSKGNNPITIIIEEVAGLAPAHRRKIEQRKRAYLDILRDTLKQLKDEGKLKAVDETVAAFSLLGMMLWLSRWYRPDGKLSRERLAEEISKIALGGLLRPQVRFSHK
ncbi:MAG: TetR/AcrR family transcriptional regulator [Acidobacteria bacterium]|nr:TetR/AcrR family transcriptional regulator [Acidobacteriota bacterium]MCI0665698.1 TetR/AcrR family transcriptional regulator [Acidobacteriota bacterium]